MNDTKQKIQEINKILLEGEPQNITVDTSTGYTGYKPQSVIDALNEIFFGEWGFSEVGSEIVPGDKGGLAVAQVQVWLAGVEFKPTSWGQNRVTRGDIGDARKGAQTDAIKKALSYFSIGNRAYQGLLKDEAKSNGASTKNAQNGRQQAGTQATGKQQAVLLTWSTVYQEGAKKRMWTRETFYATASALLEGIPVNANNVRLLSQEHLQKLHTEIEQYQAAEQSA